MKSIKVPYGGFIIDKMDSMKPSEVVTIFYWETIYTSSGLGLPHCNEKLPCPIHHKFIKIRAHLKNLFEKITLSGLLNDLDSHLLRLKK